MNKTEVEDLVHTGEGASLEFKRCGNTPHSDTFETICAFANGYGGSLLLGVEDDGTIVGVGGSPLSIERNIANVLNNPNSFDTPVTIKQEAIQMDAGVVLHIIVPPSPIVHRFKGKVYERVVDADVELRSIQQLSDLCLRKQGVYTESKVFPYAAIDDLRSDLIERARSQALVLRPDHPWKELTNEQLLRSAGLLGKDYGTGEQGLNLAALLLLGKDEVIRSVCPQYRTDAVVRIDDLDRYDDRVDVRCNLIEAYGKLSEFCRRHMPDKFHLAGDTATSPRDTIVRELVSNTLIHREYTSTRTAVIRIERDGITTENASRASFLGSLNPDTFRPEPKNPLIASFFKQIGLAEELGSGTRNLFKSSAAYTGLEPVLQEGPMFTAFVPVPPTVGKSAYGSAGADGESFIKARALELAKTRGSVTTADLVREGAARRTVQREMSALVKEGLLIAEGNAKARRYILASTER